MEGIETTKANLQRGCQASPGTQKVNTSSHHFPLDITVALEARNDPLKAETMVKELAHPSSSNAALWKGEAGSWEYRATNSVTVAPALVFHSTVILQKRGKPFKTVPVQRCHHTEWRISL